LTMAIANTAAMIRGETAVRAESRFLLGQGSNADQQEHREEAVIQ
jgi:hypothetical protein